MNFFKNKAIVRKCIGDPCGSSSRENFPRGLPVFRSYSSEPAPKSMRFLVKNAVVRSYSTTEIYFRAFRKWCQLILSPKPANVPPYEHFAQIGDPVLRKVADIVPEHQINSIEVQEVIMKMVKVMRKYDCVGIAAPQIGVSLRIIAMEVTEEKIKQFPKEVVEARKMTKLPLTVYINPTLKVTNSFIEKHPEGCMSVRGYSAIVGRYKSVEIESRTSGERQLNGWSARIAQHEMDHLNGKLYTDCMDKSTFECTCWEAVNAKSGRVEIPFYK